MKNNPPIHRTVSCACWAMLVLFLLLCLCAEATAARENPIVVENANTGTEQWRLNRSADDIGQQIKGYASATSVNVGQAITFYISVDRAQTYNIEVYRMGWYGGAGGRLMQSIGPLNGVQQAPAVQDIATGLVRYPWEPSFVLNVPSNWTSGVYLAKLTNTEGFQNYIVFVVRDDQRKADFLYQQPVTTYQAYNRFPSGTIGKSLYDRASSSSTRGIVPSEAGLDNTLIEPVARNLTRALAVSFDRPYTGQGEGQFFSWERPLVRWLEREGYDVTYVTNIDVHRQGADLLRRYKGFFSTGHDEYWSKAMYDAAEAARDSGVHLAFFGSNAVYWQIRLAGGATGAPNRTLICYKDKDLDPEPKPSLKTVRWRSVGRAEQSLIGVQYITFNSFESNTDYIVQNSDNWIYENTGFSDGDRVIGITGYEVDILFPDFPKPNSQNYTILAESPYVGESGANVVANSSVYRAPSGAWVFASGTMSWSWALDKAGLVDARIQTTTRNLLQRFESIVDATFDVDKNGFKYKDGVFSNSGKSKYSRGKYINSGGFSGGALQVRLGGRDNRDVRNMSGGWKETFFLDAPRALKLSFRYHLTQASNYENDEYSEVLLKVDGELYTDYVARIRGDGNGGQDISTGWQIFSVDLGTLGKGNHNIIIGGFNNEKTLRNEETTILIDDVIVSIDHD